MPAPDRIGVFGGTFDPPHIGHLVVALNVAAELDLDEVLFVVANVPWQKLGVVQVSPAAERLAMVRLATADRSVFRASTIEIDRGGESVTADTVDAVATRHPDAEIFVVVGSDAAAGLPTWRRADDLAAAATIAVVERPGSVGGRPPAPFRHRVVDCPRVDLSATELRARVRAGKPVDYLVPAAVVDHIAATGLYR